MNNFAYQLSERASSGNNNGNVFVKLKAPSGVLDSWAMLQPSPAVVTGSRLPVEQNMSAPHINTLPRYGADYEAERPGHLKHMILDSLMVNKLCYRSNMYISERKYPVQEQDLQKSNMSEETRRSSA